MKPETSTGLERPGASGLAAWSIYLLPALVVLVSLGTLLAVQGQAEAAAASLAGLLPVGYAFAAGLVAAVNPCGFMLLPSYLSHQLGTVGQQLSERERRWTG